MIDNPVIITVKKEELFPKVLAFYERKECQIATSLSANNFLITSNVLLCKLKLSIVVFVRVSVAAMKYHDQKASWRGKGLFIWLILPYCSSLSKEVRTRTQTWQGPGVRS